MRNTAWKQDQTVPVPPERCKELGRTKPDHEEPPTSSQVLCDGSPLSPWCHQCQQGQRGDSHVLGALGTRCPAPAAGACGSCGTRECSPDSLPLTAAAAWERGERIRPLGRTGEGSAGSLKYTRSSCPISEVPHPRQCRGSGNGRNSSGKCSL